ncbi:Pisatin demethylase [Ilyonectria robusta]
MPNFRSNAAEFLHSAWLRLSVGQVCVLIVSVLLLHWAKNKYFTRLRHVPGPFIAGCTRLWKLYHVSGGQFARVQIQLHSRYGPIVRVAPNEVLISDPSAVKIIYGHTSNFGKTKFYIPFGNKDNDDLFTDPNIARHAHNRREIAAAYSMTSLVELETFVDKCTSTMVERLHSLFVKEHNPADIASWLQYYAFDVSHAKRALAIDV